MASTWPMGGCSEALMVLTMTTGFECGRAGPMAGYSPRIGAQIPNRFTIWRRRHDAMAAVEVWWRALIEASPASGDLDGGGA